MQHRPITPTSRTRLASAAALALLVTALLASPAAAADGSFTQILCANPDTGQGLGVESVDGLTTPASATAWRATTDGACRSGPSAITLGPSSTAPVPYNGYAALHYRVDDPALTIASATYYRSFSSSDNGLEVSTRVGQHGNADPGTAAAPVNGHDWHATGQSQSAGTAIVPFSWQNAVTAVHNGRSFSVTAQCRRTGASCTHEAGEWSYRFFGGTARLLDSERPEVRMVRGSLADAGTVGTESLSFRVADQGSGVYRLRVVLGGEEIVSRDLTSGFDVTATDRHRSCFDLNPNNHDDYEFAHQQPCPASLEASLTIDTSSVSDGPRTLRAVVEDAAGNEAVLVDRTVVVDNHPLPEPGAVPDISGTPAVGAALTGANATWSGDARYDFYWDRCSTDSTCVTLVDHPGRVYVPTADDVGARMRFVVIATNDAGEWAVARSAMSEPVVRAAAPTRPGTVTPDPTAAAPPGIGAPASDAAPPAQAAAALPARGPNGRGAFRDARLTVTARGRTKLRTRFTARTPLSGRLADASGQPIAGAVVEFTARQSAAGAMPVPLGTTTTRDDGSFDFTAPPGPSRRIDVAYRASLADDRPATTASVRLVVPAAVSLRVRPARPGQTTWLTGALRHLPRAGVQIQVQALDGRRWRTFDTTTTKPGGRFRFGYRFKPPAAGRTFLLRVLVASPIYPFARGASHAARIRVPT